MNGTEKSFASQYGQDLFVWHNLFAHRRGMAGGGATIDGDWRETSGNARTDASGPRQGDEPAGVIIDQSDPADDANGGGRL